MSDSTGDTKSSEFPTVRIGGVPEHFNYPWHLARERGLYAKYGVNVEWVTQKCGTGAMIAALKAKEQDVVVALTEGLVADIAKGSNLKLLGTYVSSPLCWALSAGISDEKINSVADLSKGTFAVSRYGSGSHLMACVLASQQGWDQKAIKFEVKGNFSNLRDAVNSSSSDCFMWETFTTKPFHDKKIIKRVGQIFTPWPCFMLAARADVAAEKRDAIRRAMRAVGEAAALFHAEADTMPSVIAKRYGLKPEDAQAWYNGVRISATPTVPESAIQKALSSLRQAAVLPAVTESDRKPSDFVFDGIGRLVKPIKISYWKSRGLGAPVRMLCEYAGADYESELYEAKFTNGKLDKTCWFGGEGCPDETKTKPALIKKYSFPLLNLPFLVCDGKIVTQSVACMAFLGEKFGLYGTVTAPPPGPQRQLASARVLQCICEAQDLRNAGVKAFYGRAPAEPYINSTIPNTYAKVEAWLDTTKSKFLAGDAPSAGDFHLWEMLDQNERFATEIKRQPPTFLDKTPKLMALYRRVRALPQLKGYFNGPLYKLPCNNPHSKYPMPWTG